MNAEHREPAAGIRLPVDLERRLYAFRGRVWRIKLLEAVAAAVVGVLAGYLVVFTLDRLTETPGWVRFAAFAAAAAACFAVPLAFRRWIWGHRGLEQVARLIGRRFPSVGDQLLGIIELVRSADAPTAAAGASDTLRRAAVAQVADRARGVDFSSAIPRPRHRAWLLAAALPACLAAAAVALVPDAAANAWARFLAPWWPVERFTFTRVEPLPDTIVVPHGEPAELEVRLTEATRARPGRASVRIGGQPKLEGELAADRYTIAVPPQIAPATVSVAAGDWRQRTRLAPMLRPEITGLVAEIELPAYLGREGLLRQEVRGGTIAPLAGSRITVAATADRELESATVDGAPVEPVGTTVRTAPREAAAESVLEIAWRDRHGLAGAKPLTLSILPRSDEPPTVVALDLPANRDILLDTDTLRFRVAVRDDFGIRRVGLEWEGLADASAGEDPAARTRGERVLKAGGSDVESIEAAATFCPAALGITPQPIFLRAFAEDYKPGRPRATSTPLLIYVVDKAEHALVLNTRLAQFRQRASEVRDREMALLGVNKELRALPTERLLDDDVRSQLAGQAAAEEANARRLERLVEEGAELVREAMKNPDFEADTLERLAEDLQTLGEIAANRMPGVADLLDQAAAAKRATEGSPSQPQPGQPGKPRPGEPAASPSEQGEQLAGEPRGGEPGAQPPRAGEDRSKPRGGQGSEPGQATPPIPQVVDKESSQQPEAPATGAESSQGGGQGRLGLPSTQAGVSKPKPAGEEAAEEPPADEALAEAIAAQEKLLEEFAKVADELAAVMARLEGSTFVKRFKLASREQASIGGRLASLAADAFVKTAGRPPNVDQAIGGVRDMTQREAEKVSALMDDMQAYFDRRQLPAFRTVLEEMKDLDVLGSLRRLSDDVAGTTGISITQAEFWSDTFDRLADDLVPPQDGEGGEAGENEPRESVPPEVVLETMKILEEEMNLREETRVTEQRKATGDGRDFAAAAAALAGRQEGLADRIVDLVDRLLEEPEGERQFAREIQLFDRVEEVMAETADILRRPDTGAEAIAAESEVIELLLVAQSSRGGGGGGGGGGGMSPGGGSTGSTSDSALALLGAGNRTASEAGGEDEQATGTSGRVLPDEFRAGLDAYFNRLEKGRP
ncbi:MAG: proline-rich domain-containing protein [Planctomycetota bacterium]